MPEFTSPIVRSNLKNYGIKNETIDTIFSDIADWIGEDALPWNKSNYVRVLDRAQGRIRAELIFFASMVSRLVKSETVGNSTTAYSIYTKTESL